MLTSPPGAPLDPAAELQQIQQFVWVRYVEHQTPQHRLDESWALEVLEERYGGVGMEADAECFYYGILAFERSFAEPERRTELLERALTAFRAYRRQTSEGFAWEAVDDRYQETLEELGLAAKAAP